MKAETIGKRQAKQPDYGEMLSAGSPVYDGGLDSNQWGEFGEAGDDTIIETGSPVARFLLADDNQAVLESYRHIFAGIVNGRTSEARMLKLQTNPSQAKSLTARDDVVDFEWVFCQQGDEAVEVIRASVEEQRPFAAAFIDVRMPPGPDGVWTAERIRAMDPYVHIVMVTAYSDFDPEEIARRVPPADRLLYIQKPFHVVEIRRFVWALSTKWRAEKLSRRMQAKLQSVNEQLTRDILARQQAEQRLAESEEKYRNLVENVRDVIIQISSQGIFQYVSPTIKQLAGYDAEAALGNNVTEYIAEADRPRVAEVIQDAVRSGQSETIEFMLISADGNQFPVEVSALPLIEEGRVVAFQCVLRDITDRKQAEQALQQAYQRDQTILNTSMDGFYIFRLDGSIGDCNAAYCKMLGYSRDELLTMKITDLEAVETPEQTAQHIQQIMQTGSDRFETAYKRKDGGLVHLEVSTTFVELPDGSWFICFARDITKRKQVEEERGLLEQQLFQAQKLESLATLAGGVAHDFNNLLTGIIGMTELALRQIDPDLKAYEYLHKVCEQGRRGAELIASLSAFSRRAVSEQQPIVLRPLVKETVTLLQRTLPETIKVRTNWPDYLPLVNADPTQMQQVIMNLGTNARDAMPNGGELTVGLAKVTLDEQYCRQHADVAPGDYVCLSVCDTGVGMTIEVQKHIFEPFFTTKDTGKGTGLGLAMVYGIVKEHKGHIGVYSKVGKGTEFKVYLPAMDAGLAAEHESENESLVGGPETVLFVEDDVTVLGVGEEMLQSLGYNVLTALNGKAGLEVYHEHQEEIALVVTDMTMPEMGGEGLYDQLLEAKPGVKVLLVSGYSLKEEVSALKAKGLKGFVQKPFNLQVLAVAVRQAIDD